MDILKIVTIGLMSTIVIVLLKETKPELAILLGVSTGIVLVILIVDGLYEVVLTFYNIASITGIQEGIFGGILKIVGIGYLTEFASNICADAGIKSVGDKIQFGGKVVIMLQALPILTSLLNVILEILP